MNVMINETTKRSRRLSLAVLLFLMSFFLAAKIGAQEMHSTKLMSLAFSGAHPNFFYRSSGKIVEMDISRYEMGAPVEYRGPRNLFLYKDKTLLENLAKGDPLPKPDLFIVLPTKAETVLLGFSKGEGEEAPKVEAFGLSKSRLKGGDYIIMNYSSKNVFAILNGKKVGIKKGGKGEIRNLGNLREKVQDMDIKFGLRSGNSIKTVYSSLWGHRPERRTFVLIFDRGNKYNPLEVRMFYDLPEFDE